MKNTAATALNGITGTFRNPVKTGARANIRRGAITQDPLANSIINQSPVTESRAAELVNDAADLESNDGSTSASNPEPYYSDEFIGHLGNLKSLLQNANIGLVTSGSAFQSDSQRSDNII